MVSLEAWDSVWRRNQHLVSRLLEADPGLRVVFVEPPLDPTHDLRSGRLPRLPRGLRDGGHDGRLRLLRPVKLLPRRLDVHADERLAVQVERAVHRRGITDPVLWVNDPGGAVLARRTGWRTLYDMTDDWLSADRPAAELARIREQEEWLLAEADEVVACSTELLRRKSPLRARGRQPLRLVQNAVDVAAYRRRHERPRDLPAGKVVLYLGTLHADRLDVGLTSDIARSLGGEATVVLVGPDSLSAGARATLATAGAVLLGPRPRNSVPAYLQHANVLIVPHVITGFTDSLDPIKLYEYQAADRPVVATAVAGFRDAQDPRVRIATPEDFVRTIRAGLTKRSQGRPTRDVADWDERADQMRGILSPMW
ncbi:hypothetical protein GCM10027411_12220 [Microbacterium aureliae]